MITYWDVYWVTRLDSINSTFTFLVVAGVLLSVLFIFILVMAWDIGFPGLVKTIKRVFIPLGIIILVVGGVGKTFTPTTKEACVIYLLPKIANNQQVQKIPENFAKLLNTKMEAWINDSVVDGRKK